MAEEFIHLKQFLGGYFHQDWPMEADSADQILHRYADEECMRVRLAVAREIAQLLSAPDSVIDATVRQLGSYYDPSIEELSMRRWLEKVEQVLQAK